MIVNSVSWLCLLKVLVNYSLFFVFSFSTMYVFGGFNSLLLSDILVFTSERCEAHQSEAACLAAGPGIRCVWDTGSSQCISWELATEAQEEKLKSECFSKRSMFFFLLKIKLIWVLILSASWRHLAYVHFLDSYYYPKIFNNICKGFMKNWFINIFTMGGSMPCVSYNLSANHRDKNLLGFA